MLVLLELMSISLEHWHYFGVGMISQRLGWQWQAWLIAESNLNFVIGARIVTFRTRVAVTFWRCQSWIIDCSFRFEVITDYLRHYDFQSSAEVCVPRTRTPLGVEKLGYKWPRFEPAVTSKFDTSLPVSVRSVCGHCANTRKWKWLKPMLFCLFFTK